MVGKLFQFQTPQQGVKPGQTSSREMIVNVEKRVEFWTALGPEPGLPGTRYDKKHSTWWSLSYIPLCVILILLFLIVLLPLMNQIDLRVQYSLNQEVSAAAGEDKCSFQLVESIPEGLTYPDGAVKFPSTYETWKKLLQLAEHTIEIGSFYWTLRKWDKFPAESHQGDDIFNGLLDAGLRRNITVRIAANKPAKKLESNDTEYLIATRAASVKFLDFDALVGAGILHTKFWIVDRRHVYVGSANLDWRALTQVKELGIAFFNCSSVAADLSKVFDVYWQLGNQTELPSSWPADLATPYNSKNPLRLDLNGQRSSLFLTSSPPPLSPPGRNDDLAGLLQIIKDAKEFVHISVMEYLPLVVFSKELKFWPVIDDALRSAVVERKVQVRLLISDWTHTKSMTYNFLRSLIAVNKFKKSAVLEVRMFNVPSNGSQSKIPFARVNHNKYMVTDNGAFIGTSNWSGDYFLSTAGVSVVSPASNGTVNVIQQQLKSVFDRDWNSSHSKPLTFEMFDAVVPLP